MNTRAAYVGIALTLFGADALAGVVTLSQGVGAEPLRSGSLSDVSLVSTKHGLSSTALQAAHAAFNADGISTDGKVTIAAMDTPQGMAILVLIDDVLGSAGAPVQGRLQMSSVVDSVQSSFVNDTSALIKSNVASGLRSARGEFTWNSNGGGAGFAWLNLGPGSNAKFQFEQVAGDTALESVGTFQFVTWNGSSWKRVELTDAQTSFSSDGQFGFSAMVAIPLPTSAALAGVSCLGLALRRRR
jgi:hypothetical protein